MSKLMLLARVELELESSSVTGIWAFSHVVSGRTYISHIFIKFDDVVNGVMSMVCQVFNGFLCTDSFDNLIQTC